MASIITVRVIIFFLIREINDFLPETLKDRALYQLWSGSQTHARRLLCLLLLRERKVSPGSGDRQRCLVIFMAMLQVMIIFILKSMSDCILVLTASS